MNKITIRKASLEDIETLRQLFVKSIEGSCGDDYGPDQIKVWTSSVNNKERWTQLVANQYAIVAEIQGVIVGYGTLKAGHYLDHLYVSHDHQRKGVASLLFDHLKARSLEDGHAQMSVDVSITALPFFKSRGFSVLKENRNVRDGTVIINYHMKDGLLEV